MRAVSLPQMSIPPTLKRISRCLFISALLLLLFAAGAGLAFVYSGVVNVYADRPHTDFTYWLFSTTRQRSFEMRAADVQIPADLDSDERAARAVVQYETLCAPCHLRPGMEVNAVHRGLNPEPPRLSRFSASPAYTFLVVKHGIRSTGMPAWGKSLDDDEVWDLVALQRRLPALAPGEYETLLRETEKRAQ